MKKRRALFFQTADNSQKPLNARMCNPEVGQFFSTQSHCMLLPRLFYLYIIWFLLGAVAAEKIRDSGILKYLSNAHQWELMYAKYHNNNCESLFFGENRKKFGLYSSFVDEARKSCIFQSTFVSVCWNR